MQRTACIVPGQRDITNLRPRSSVSRFEHRRFESQKTTLRLERNLKLGVTAFGDILSLTVSDVTALKRREAKRIGNPALAADATQSATCAYLAAVTLAGLAINALWHVAWVDAVAALAAVPVLIVEGWRTWRGALFLRDST